MKPVRVHLSVTAQDPESLTRAVEILARTQVGLYLDGIRDCSINLFEEEDEDA